MKNFFKNFEKNAKDFTERRTNEGSFGRFILAKLVSICVFLINLVGLGANSASTTKARESEAPRNNEKISQNQLKIVKNQPKIASFLHAVADDVVNNGDDLRGKNPNTIICQIRAMNCEATEDKKILILTRPEVELKEVKKNADSFIFSFNCETTMIDMKFEINTGGELIFTNTGKSGKIEFVGAVPITSLPVINAYKSPCAYIDFWKKAEEFSRFDSYSIKGKSKENTEKFLKFFESGSKSLRSSLEYPFSDFEVVTANEIGSVSKSFPDRRSDEVLSTGRQQKQ